MHQNLTIDQGNTHAKAALWTTEVPSRCTSHHTISHHTDLSALLDANAVDTAIYSSVSGYDPVIISSLRHHCNKVIILSPQTPIPLEILYRTPHTLGLDRLAAAVGAATLVEAQGRELLIIDLGTAITYDRVTAKSQYIGGNIAPGIYMRLQALNHYTVRLPLIEPAEHPLTLWGTDTTSALCAGAINGVLAEINYYRHHLPEDTLTVITGGGAELIMNHLHIPHLHIPDLVSLGLNQIIQYNNNH